jgi:carbamoyl-phosphate synthase large subunit
MISLQGVNVFVSGAAGVIGGQIVPSLLDAGANVFAADLKPCPKHWGDIVMYRMGDLNELSREELSSFSPEIFIHLAATFERSIETLGFWDDNFHNNVRLSHHLMSQARHVRSLKRVVFASSYLCYEPNLYMRNSMKDGVPAALKESDNVRPRNLVGMAKLAHEQELQFLSDSGAYPFSHVSARIFRGYGAGSRDYISRLVRKLIQGEELKMYRTEGEFDYIYASDSAEGLIRLAGAENYSGVINLGTGVRRSVSDVIDILLRHFPGALMTIEPSVLQIESSEADISALAKLTDWRPTTTLEEGIALIVEHERKIFLR